MAIYSLDGIAPNFRSGNEVWIAPNAVVLGSVELGRWVSVWYGATIRGDNEPIRIGEGSNIQESCILHTDPGFPVEIGAACTIGHGAIIHGCTIGQNSLIGMGAIVLNGARIGENCLIGAGSLISEGKEIPDGSLVYGSPGKVIRQLDLIEITSLTKSSKVYVEKAKLHRASLQEITSI